MAGRDEPPDGAPDGLPGGGEDEYRSVVFDESFIRAARLQEFSAQERMGDHAPAVRSRSVRLLRGPRQMLVVLMVVTLALGAAIFMGVRHPYLAPGGTASDPLRSTVIPLAPRGAVPGGTAAGLFAHSPAAQFRIGAAGVNPPAFRRTSHFSDVQVSAALAMAKKYVVESSLDPAVLMGGSTDRVRALLAPDQYSQFEQSLASPSADGGHAATGWLVRFDPAQVALADPQVRVSGTLAYQEVAAGTLEVASDHVFVYALRPAATGPAKAGGASLFTVRREVRFRFGTDDLRLQQARLASAYVQAGPQSCTADAVNRLRPLLAGQHAAAGGPAGTDPYATGQPAAALCGTLAVRP
ncbi:hypothetical protein OG709_11080 [Streptomyces sp. NBC_01267]|uniref:SCO2583 family membrane protein n=1 Tax=Streptomyces sp. NBC_01267 TaxID=2903805 RepID=UPI002E2F1BBB|nr:hypothetical protein [Streptomyces sp. NBC_01267]